ncbi:hypothetical protein KF707C_49580 [Metapseudomonas furukawaii]|uniref:Uncharacterized protein n=1 Tax=Metapseudomonas furukawaii TaxID=1149133 RepID=A0AAD1FHG1_METFU|nr:hypothetical protein KF707C_49580 [Pseudomonas furukawaii]
MCRKTVERASVPGLIQVGEVRGLRRWAAGGGIEVFVPGQLVDQRLAGLGRRDIGLAFLQPLELAVPGRQLGGGQREDIVDLGDFGRGVGVVRKDAPDRFVAFGAFEVFLLVQVVECVRRRRPLKCFPQAPC